MVTNNNLPNRQSSRMPWYNYRQSGYYFVTICTLGRHHAFGRIIDAEMYLSNEGNICEQIWLSLPERFTNVAIDTSVFMPNHIHGIIVLKKPPVIVETSNIPDRFKAHMQKLENERLTTQPEAYKVPSLGQIVRTFKAASTRLIRRNGSSSFAWQENYWLTVISTKEHLKHIQQYIHQNPATWQNDQLYTIK
jgi:REP element-mobilizing transposase RayT